MRVKIRGLTIEVSKGDISEAKADAIVNAANSELWMGSGVAGALKRRGGQEIEREAMGKGPIKVGGAVATSAGRLQAKWVIHAAAIGPDLATDEDKIRAATSSSLLRASELGARSIAMPSLGTGVGGFSPDRAADIMMDAVMKHAEREALPELVQFVLFSDDIERAYLAALDRAMKRI